MKPYSLIERAGFYAKAFPKWPAPRADDRWMDGMWIMGNNYKTSGYYGAFPHTYLERVNSMFPDAERVLHLFAGSLPKGNYTRFDLTEEKSDGVWGNAEFLATHMAGRTFDLIHADPPYSIEDCEHYGCAMVNRNKVVQQCSRILEPGGYLVWLDQVLPMFKKEELSMVGVIGMVKSTNHRFRVVTIFRKL